MSMIIIVIIHKQLFQRILDQTIWSKIQASVRHVLIKNKHGKDALYKDDIFVAGLSPNVAENRAIQYIVITTFC